MKFSLGFSLSEVVVAVGFLAIFTTGLLAIATKSITLSSRQVDMAAIYQYAETEMEDVTLRASAPANWDTIVSETTPQYAKRPGPAGAEKFEDKRFVTTLQIEDLDADLKYVTVTVYHAKPNTPAIDTSRPRKGEIIQFVNLLQRL